jgi:hypothetical protein
LGYLQLWEAFRRVLEFPLRLSLDKYQANGSPNKHGKSKAHGADSVMDFNVEVWDAGSGDKYAMRVLL